LLAPRLIDKKHELQFSGGHIPSLLNLFFWTFFIDDIPLVKQFFPAYHLEHNCFYKKKREFGWLQGACYIVKTKNFRQINGFDKKFFMYAEDIDLCYRLKNAGLKNTYSPSFQLIHLGSGEGSQRSIVGEYLGLIYFFHKHKGIIYAKIIRYLLLINSIIRYIIFGILLKDEKKNKIYQKSTKVLSQHKI